MIALLLGIISLAIALMFSASFDKLANEVKDIRLKCLQIDYLFRTLNNTSTTAPPKTTETPKTTTKTASS